MIPALPTELTQHILEHALDSYIDWDNPEIDILAADGFIRQLLLAASLVSSSWRPLAQDLLLRRVGITTHNCVAFIGYIQERGPAFANSIRSLRMVGDRAVPVMGSNEGEPYRTVLNTTRLLERALALLPGVEHLELVRVLAQSSAMLMQRTCPLNIHLFDSGLLSLRAGDLRPNCPSLTLWPLPSSALEEVDRVGLAATTLQGHAFNTLHWRGLGGIEFQLFLILKTGSTWGFADVKHLSLEASSACNMTSSWKSPWTPFTSLETLRAPFRILLEDFLPPYPSPPHPLPSTLRILTLLPECSTQAAPTASTTPMRSDAIPSLADLTAILLATVQALSHLQELAVEDLLHGGELEQECEARGIRLRSSVGA